jgi:hypothetical protein
VKPRRGRRGLVRLVPGDLVASGDGAFLGRLDAPALRHELEEAGILRGLAQRGYAPVKLELSREDNEHRLLVRAAGPGKTELPPLIELRLDEEVVLARDLEPRPAGFEVLSVLAIRWLAMQDPGARFTPERPRLPGQRYPGLGLTRPLILRIHDWAKVWGKDALVNYPEFFHNAVFYSALYRFVSPERQGRFEALQRDIGSLPIAESSRAVEEGRVIEEPAGQALRWEPGEMIVPLTEPVRSWIEAAAYAEAAARAREAARFWVRGEAA